MMAFVYIVSWYIFCSFDLIKIFLNFDKWWEGRQSKQVYQDLISSNTADYHQNETP